MKKPEGPCLDCLDRVVGCHAYCESYKSFRTALDEWNGIHRAYKQREGVLEEHVAATIKRRKRTP